MKDTSTICQEILERINSVTDNELKNLIIELIANQMNLNKEALIDPLTNINNRRILSTITNYNVIVMCDIDNFKQINDNYGHGVGDKVLIFMAKILSANIRPCDYLCRYGGDEFLIAFTNCNEEIAVNRMKNIQTQLLDNHIIPSALTISVGIAVKDENDTIKSSLNKADKALYYSKLSGKDTITVNGNGVKKKVKVI